MENTCKSYLIKKPSAHHCEDGLEMSIKDVFVLVSFENRPHHRDEDGLVVKSFTLMFF